MNKHDQSKETCFTCDKLLRECKCNVTDTYSDIEGPICPYCGYMNKACDSDGHLYDESTTEWYCANCDETFDVSIYVSHTWHSYTKGKDD